MDYPARRRQQVVQSLSEEGLNLLLISNPVNVTYLTGFSGESSYLLLSPSRALVVSDGRFTQQLAEECPGLDVVIRPPQQPLAQAVAAALNEFGGRSVGFESNHLNVAERELLGGLTPSLDWKGAPERVERLRAVKDPSEIEQIRDAIAIAERAFGMFRAMLRGRDTEKELSDALEMYIRRAGGKCSSFPAIVAVGERAALPHAPPTNRAVADAELLLVDWGASGPFYKSDLTRVLLARKNRSFARSASRERLDSKLETIYAVVRAAQDKAFAAVRPGVPAKEVDAAARGVIADAGYGSCFTHGLGHGIGLQVHEAPALRASSTDVLEAGMVVTIEPGIYVPGWGGIRLEDDVLVTPDGCEVLTSVSKDIADCTLAIAD